MAVYVNDDVYLTVGGVDLSDHIKSGQLTINGEIVDVSAMGTSWRQRLGGVKDWKIEVEFYADFAAANTYHTLIDALNTSTALVYHPDGAAGGTADNPSFTGNGIMESIPIGGAFAETAMFGVTFLGNGALVIDDVT